MTPPGKLVFVLGCLLGSLAPATAQAEDGLQTPYVLAVGVNDPSAGGLAPLSYADDDAAEAVRLFDPQIERSYLHTRFDSSSVERHQALASRARPPTLAAVRQSVAALKRKVEADLQGGGLPHVVVWLAGHGARDDDGHLYYPLHDGGRLTASSLIDEIVAPLSGAHRVHVVVDTCFAGGLVNARAQVDDAAPDEVKASLLLASPTRFPNVGVLVGSTAGTQSYEWNEISSGVFSAVLRAGLRGAADVDGDGAVRYSELVAFATAAAEGVKVPEARPHVQGTPPAIDSDAPVSLKAWLGPTRSLRGELADLGTVHVLDDTGRWLLASRFERGFTPELWLPAEATLFLRARGRDHRLTPDEDGGLRLGEPVPQATAARSLMEDALREGLFAATWGPTFWRGFRAGEVAGADRVAAEVERQGLSGASVDEDGLPWLGIGAGALGGFALVAGAATLIGGLAVFAYATQQRLQVPALTAYGASAGLGGVGVGLLAGGVVVASLATVLVIGGE